MRLWWTALFTHLAPSFEKYSFEIWISQATKKVTLIHVSMFVLEKRFFKYNSHFFIIPSYVSVIFFSSFIFHKQVVLFISVLYCILYSTCML